MSGKANLNPYAIEIAYDPRLGDNLYDESNVIEEVVIEAEKTLQNTPYGVSKGDGRIITEEIERRLPK